MGWLVKPARYYQVHRALELATSDLRPRSHLFCCLGSILRPLSGSGQHCVDNASACELFSCGFSPCWRWLVFQSNSDDNCGVSGHSVAVTSWGRSPKTETGCHTSEPPRSSISWWNPEFQAGTKHNGVRRTTQMFHFMRLSLIADWGEGERHRTIPIATEIICRCNGVPIWYPGAKRPRVPSRSKLSLLALLEVGKPSQRTKKGTMKKSRRARVSRDRDRHLLRLLFLSETRRSSGEIRPSVKVEAKIAACRLFCEQ